MRTCNYDFIEIGFRGNKWISGCKKEILYVTELGKGVSTPPTPTDKGAKFCTFCGKKIKLTSRKPKQQPKLSLVPEERPPKPNPLPRPEKPVAILRISENHDTYDAWQARGYQVQRGEKMVGRSPDGIAMFHRNQVKEIPDREYDPEDDVLYPDKD